MKERGGSRIVVAYTIWIIPVVFSHSLNTHYKIHGILAFFSVQDSMSLHSFFFFSTGLPSFCPFRVLVGVFDRSKFSSLHFECEVGD